MSTGALIFAFNNEHIDYLSLAAWSADNIRRHLGIPVAVVTNKLELAKQSTLLKFDKIINASEETGGTRFFQDIGNRVSWHNATRMDAYRLSPWQTTLLLDADYVVASDQLTKILNADCEILAHSKAIDATGIDDFSTLNVFGTTEMPMWWATVVKFNKSQTSELVFDAMRMIKQHWKHYCRLYKIGNSVYRNDYALSIALNIVYGHTLEIPSIPWPLVSVLPNHLIKQTETDKFKIEFNGPDNKAYWVNIVNQDFHAMGKKHLGDIIAESNT